MASTIIRLARPGSIFVPYAFYAAPATQMPPSIVPVGAAYVVQVAPGVAAAPWLAAGGGLAVGSAGDVAGLAVG